MPNTSHGSRPRTPRRARIDSVDSLRQHLQWAIELEHATLPPYLCALYSIDHQRNPEATQVVASVFVEEMLHLALVANLLNAVGGQPVIDAPIMMPGYPSTLPHGDRSFEIPLVPFGMSALELFLRIEQPTPARGHAESDEYATIGQFYAAIVQGVRRLCSEFGESAVFCGDPARQVSDVVFHRGGGKVFAIDNLATALQALREIVEQGEGASHHDVWDGDHQMVHPAQGEVAHYYRFQELKLGRRYQAGDTPQSGPTGEAVTVDWGGVWPMQPNPSTATSEPDSPIRRAQDEFNHAYCAVLHLLEQAFNGSPGVLAVAMGGMYGLKSMAVELMQMPVGNGELTAGPTFEYIPKSQRRWSTGDTRRIVVLANGPYLVYGQIPLTRKRKIVSASNDSVLWRTTDTVPTEETYALCRCGRSGSKPFCDGTHADGRFDGTETAETGTYASRMRRTEGDGVSVRRVGSLCMHAAFCVGRTEQLDAMIPRTGDSDVRAHVTALIDRCPSGSYTYGILPADEPIEVDLPVAIAVIEEEQGLASGLWVTGRIPVLRADGQAWEARNRMMLCRCGQSHNKPLCDGTHRLIGFRE